MDLLIGINYLHFHVGETQVKNRLAVGKSPLGYAVFGADDGRRHKGLNQVMNVCLAAPIDLTELLKTKSMSVAISPCQCWNKSDQL